MKVDIDLSEKQLKFLTWLANYDNRNNPVFKWDCNKEVKVLALIKIDEYLEYYKKEGLYNG